MTESKVVPTKEMLDAGEHVLSERLNDNAPIGAHIYREPAKAAYLAMLAAAPAPVPTTVPEEFAARCRPAVKAYLNRAEMALFKIGKEFPEHYRPALAADAKNAAELLQEIDKILAAPAPDPAAESLAQKERDRQYHMDAINRLASFLGFHGTSFEVVQAAIDNITRLAKPKPPERRTADTQELSAECAARTGSLSAESAAPLLTESEIDSICVGGLGFCGPVTFERLCDQAKLAIRLQQIVDSDPAYTTVTQVIDGQCKDKDCPYFGQSKASSCHCIDDAPTKGKS